jgi:hypothetical protein
VGIKELIDCKNAWSGELQYLIFLASFVGMELGLSHSGKTD